MPPGKDMTDMTRGEAGSGEAGPGEGRPGEGRPGEGRPGEVTAGQVTAGDVVRPRSYALPRTTGQSIGPTALELENLVMHFGAVRAVDGV